MDAPEDLFAPPADSDYSCSLCLATYHRGPCRNPWRWLWLRVTRQGRRIRREHG